MRTYDIKREPVIINGNSIEKYNVYYYDGEVFIGKEYHSTDGVNGTIKDGFVKMGSPSWLNLEQSLRYSSLFNKAWLEASDKGFNLFTVTLINGKSGAASENALAFAFQMLDVDWADEEKKQINQILSENGFTIKI